jgi:hypothetical protein
MMKGYLEAARIACLVQFCATGFAFQASSDGPLQTVPLARPAKAVSADRSPALVRVDSSLVLIPVHVTAASGALSRSGRKTSALFEDGVRETITHFAKDDARCPPAAS